MSQAMELSEERSRYGRDLPRVGVHALSEQVFCNRAGLLAQLSGTDTGEEDEPNLGPKLDWWGDYEERSFAEAIDVTWGELRYWLTWLVASLAGFPMAWMLTSSLWGRGPAFVAIWLVCIPVLVCGRNTLFIAGRLIQLLRAQALWARSTPVTLDLASEVVREVNWWSLRKAGFDCRAPIESYYDPVLRLAGKPWRVLSKDRTLRIPVIRKHRGDRSWGPQHLVRVAAYCHLIESQEGAEAPFGILLFADSYDGLIVPNTLQSREQFRRALDTLRELLATHGEDTVIAAGPSDNRCLGCPWGAPRVATEESATILEGRRLSPKLAKGRDGQWRHSPCADLFGEVPPHAQAIALEMALPRAPKTN